jgi:recombination protein RecR
MQKRVTGPEIERLIQLLARVPGLGTRSARRAALHLIKKKDQLMGPLALAMNEAFDKVQHLFDLRQRRHCRPLHRLY